MPPGRTPPGKRPGFRAHLGKPQYLDFRNPLLVDLFSRMTESLEMLLPAYRERWLSAANRFQLAATGLNRQRVAAD